MNHSTLLVVFLCTVTVLASAGVAAGAPAGVAPPVPETAGESSQSASPAIHSGHCEYPVEVTDATGETVRLEERPDDIVVLGPSAAQHMWELGAQDRVTGMPVNQYTAYLKGSDEREDVVDEVGQPVQERVVAQDPDLILAPNIVSEDAVESLRAAGYTVYYSPLMVSLEDMYAELDRVGTLAGKCGAANETIAETRQQVTAIETAVADEERPTVYYDLGFPWTAGENTLENELITKAGGRNIALEANESGYFEISEEVIAANDPDWIIVSEGSEVPDRPALQESTAVREGQIIEVNSNYISQHGPRVTIPLETLATAFHPEAMADIEDDTDAESTDSASRAGTGNTSDDSTNTAPDGNGPGFGIAVALGALCLLGSRYRL